MSRQLTVNNTPFQYPTDNQNPGWGGQATGWATEVTEALNNLIGPNDILETSFNIANDQITPTDVTGLVFNNGSVRSAVIEYSIFRLSDTNPSDNTETGEIHLVYDNNSGWLFSVGGVVGNAGVNFSITAGGQFQYTSTDIDTLNYIGVIKFKAKSLSQ